MNLQCSKIFANCNMECLICDDVIEQDDPFLQLSTTPTHYQCWLSTCIMQTSLGTVVSKRLHNIICQACTALKDRAKDDQTKDYLTQTKRLFRSKLEDAALMIRLSKLTIAQDGYELLREVREIFQQYEYGQIISGLNTDSGDLYGVQRQVLEDLYKTRFAPKRDDSLLYLKNILTVTDTSKFKNMTVNQKALVLDMLKWLHDMMLQYDADVPDQSNTYGAYCKLMGVNIMERFTGVAGAADRDILDDEDRSSNIVTELYPNDDQIANDLRLLFKAVHYSTYRVFRTSTRPPWSVIHNWLSQSKGTEQAPYDELERASQKQLDDLHAYIKTMRPLIEDSMGKMIMCPRCMYGPIPQSYCLDMGAHHGYSKDGNTDNRCPNCTFYSNRIGRNANEWMLWDGVPRRGPDDVFPTASVTGQNNTFIRPPRPPCFPYEDGNMECLSTDESTLNKKFNATHEKENTHPKRDEKDVTSLMSKLAKCTISRR